MSVSDTVRSLPTTLSISACTLFITSGWRMSSAMPHSTVLEEESEPARSMSCRTLYVGSRISIIHIIQHFTSYELQQKAIHVDALVIRGGVFATVITKA